MSRERTLRRRLEHKLAKQKQRLPGNRPGHAFLTSTHADRAAPHDVASWPIVASFAPIPAVWAATGQGCAAIVRRAPDGRRAEAIFWFDAREGLSGAAGSDDKPDEGPRLIESIRAQIPPYEPARPEAVTDFVFGALARAAEDGCTFPGIDRYLAVVPAPIDRRASLERFFALIPPALVELVDGLPEEAFTERGEPMVLTAVQFALADASAATSAFRARSNDFEALPPDADGQRFRCTRPFPARDPRGQGGARQEIGEVAVRDDRLIAAWKSLSMGARFLGEYVATTLGSLPRLERVEWFDPSSRRRLAADF